MKINKIYDITLNTDDTIMTATLSKSNEVVMLMNSGSVIRFNLENKSGEHLFSVKSNIGYSDGGFDVKAKTSIYTMDEIVIVANDYKRHGFVHYPDKYDALHLWREDYHVDISFYPIALYKNFDGIPHLIFAEAWNHIQIMNLNTRQILTASKSLIEEHAEERHIEFYTIYTEDNKLAWPRPYDYFFGKLFISPNQKKFLSAGWAWGSYDSYHVFDIDNFISSNRITDLKIGVWEHENRATCWVDNETLAIMYNPFIEGDENSTEDSTCEIHFYKINKQNVAIEKKIQTTEMNILNSRMYFNRSINSFITISDKVGLLVITLEGQTVYKDENFKINEYNVDTDCFLIADNKTIIVYELIE